MQPVYMVAGVSGSGKSWVCRQLKDKFNYVPHDICWTHPHARPDKGDDPKWGPPGSVSIHPDVISEMARYSKRPVLTEVPFAERELKETLERNGHQVIPVFVIEHPAVIAERYEKREGKPATKGVLARASSIIDRAKEWNAFHGTSEEVFKHLKDIQF
jgi:hypothetical protein